MEKLCVYCGVSFWVKPSVLLRKGKGRFCSKGCVKAANADHKQAAPLTERFWSKVDIGSFEECWPFIGSTSKGYGSFRLKTKKTTGAHRVAFFLVYGYWPDSFVLHSCDNRLCCNPCHLRNGNHQDNTKDMMDRGRSAKGERHSQAKLSQKSVDEIKISLKRGETRKSLALNYAVHETTICDIALGRTWNH